MSEYAEFLSRKGRSDPPTGLTTIPELPEQLFPFQHDIVTWALRRGRAAIFAQTGLGKSFMELAWGKAVHEATGGNVLLLTPLAVAGQMVREANKFGLPAKQCSQQSEVEPGVTVTNYAKLHHFDLSQFVGVILDESSILKAFDGKTRTLLIERCAQIPYRLAATATPAPNDFTELGNHAEFLGVMSLTGMQAVFFTHDGGDTGKWRLKGHAEDDFWRWMCSWAVLLRKPSDLGYDDGAYDLPPMEQFEHIVPVEGDAAKTLSERLRARRESINERVSACLDIILDNGVLYGVETGILGEQTTAGDGESRVERETFEFCQGEPATESGRAKEIYAGVLLKKPSEISVENTGRAEDAEREASGDIREFRGCEGENQEQSERMANGEPRQAEGAAVAAVRPNIGPVQSNAQGSELPMQNLRVFGYEQPEEVSGSGSLPFDRGSAGLALWKLQFSDWLAGREHRKDEGSNSVYPRPWLIWCNLNSEQDALESLFGDLAFSVRGADSEQIKEQTIQRWLDLERPIMISKASIMGFGMNFQFCADTVFVGLNDSFEQVYQAVRRFWRFGQDKPVSVHFVAASTEGAVLENLRRKEADAERMGAMMVAHMADISGALIHGTARQTDEYHPTTIMTVPFWLEDVA